MRAFLAITLFIFSLNTSDAVAEGDGPVDVSEILCIHLVDLSEEEFSFILAWLDGYFNHMHGTTILSEASLESLGAMVLEGCSTDSERNVMEMLNERIRQDALNQHP